MSQVIGVHGMAQQQGGRNQLLREWEPALRDGIELALGRNSPQPSFDLAFYGSRFLSDGDSQASRVMKGSPSGDLGAEMVDLDGDELDFLVEAVSEASEGRPDLGEPMGFPRMPAPLLPVARELTRRFDLGAALNFIRTLRQVRLYLADNVLAQSLRDVVLDSIGSDSRVLVAHSLGTVVALDTLNLNPDARIDTLVTLGSPLAMRVVSKRLRFDGTVDGLVPKPAQVRRWVNVLDPRDPVAAAGQLDRLWPGVEDHIVDNEDNPHSVARYLTKRPTGLAISEGAGVIDG